MIALATVREPDSDDNATVLGRLAHAAKLAWSGEAIPDLSDLADQPLTEALVALIVAAASLGDAPTEVPLNAAETAKKLNALRASVNSECRLIRNAGQSLSTALESTMMTSCDLMIQTSEASDSMATANAASSELIEVSESVVTRANLAKSEAQRAGQTANEGSRSVDLLVNAMGTIDHIIGSIKEVTFRINLLAINAQIEAAHAGERGRGFAVVAQEVKTLAARTAELSREIGERLNEIRSNAGSAQVSFHQIEQAIESANASIADLVENQQRLTLAVKDQARQTQENVIKMSSIADMITNVQSTINETGDAYSQLNQSLEVLTNASHSDDGRSG